MSTIMAGAQVVLETAMSNQRGSQQRKGLKSFKQFNDLPIELRLDIWKLSIPQDRVVAIIDRRSRVERGDSFVAQCAMFSARYTVPATMQVCQESRNEIKKSYVYILRSQLGVPVPFNFNFDTLLMDGPEGSAALWSFEKAGRRNSRTKSELAMIHAHLKHLIISGQRVGPRLLNEVQQFTGLETLILPANPYWNSPDGHDAFNARIADRLRLKWTEWKVNKPDAFVPLTIADMGTDQYGGPCFEKSPLRILKNVPNYQHHLQPILGDDADYSKINSSTSISFTEEEALRDMLAGRVKTTLSWIDRADHPATKGLLSYDVKLDNSIELPANFSGTLTARILTPALRRAIIARSRVINADWAADETTCDRTPINLNVSGTFNDPVDLTEIDRPVPLQPSPCPDSTVQYANTSQELSVINTLGLDEKSTGVGNSVWTRVSTIIPQSATYEPIISASTAAPLGVPSGDAAVRKLTLAALDSPASASSHATGQAVAFGSSLRSANSVQRASAFNIFNSSHDDQSPKGGSLVSPGWHTARSNVTSEGNSTGQRSTGIGVIWSNNVVAHARRTKVPLPEIRVVPAFPRFMEQNESPSPATSPFDKTRGGTTAKRLGSPFTIAGSTTPWLPQSYHPSTPTTASSLPVQESTQVEERPALARASRASNRVTQSRSVVQQGRVRRGPAGSDHVNPNHQQQPMDRNSLTPDEFNGPDQRRRWGWLAAPNTPIGISRLGEVDCQPDAFQSWVSQNTELECQRAGFDSLENNFENQGDGFAVRHDDNRPKSQGPRRSSRIANLINRPKQGITLTSVSSCEIWTNPLFDTNTHTNKEPASGSRR